MSNEDFVVVTEDESESYPEDESGFSERTSYSRDRNATTSDTQTDSEHKEEEHDILRQYREHSPEEQEQT